MKYINKLLLLPLLGVTLVFTACDKMDNLPSYNDATNVTWKNSQLGTAGNTAWRLCGR